MEDNLIAFGSEIRRLREASGITQQQLADAVNCNMTYISKIENGKISLPSDTLIRRICRVLQSPSTDLFILGGKINAKKLRRAAAQSPEVAGLLFWIQEGWITPEQAGIIYRNIRENSAVETGE